LHDLPSTTQREPLTKVGREGIEVVIEPVTGKERDATRSQGLSQGVKNHVRHVLRARTQKEHRKNLGAGINGQPEPQHLCGVAQPGAQFVQLEVREPEMTEGALMEDLSVPACASEPCGDGGLTVAEDPTGFGSIQPLGQRRQDHGDLMGRGFQTVQGGVTSSTERGAASRTSERLDLLGMAMLAISDEGVDLSIGDAEVRTLLVGTSEALGVHSLGCSPPAFHLTPGAYWRRGRLHAWRGETAKGAIKRGARLEQTVDQSPSAPYWCMGKLKMRPRKATKQREREEKEAHEQKQENVESHNEPRRLK
jgi:hypothetical protein